MDSIKSSAIPLNIGAVSIDAASKILNEQEADMKRTVADIDTMQKSRDGVELTLKMPRKERIKTANELYSLCYDEKYRNGGVKTAEMLLLGGCTAGFFAGAAAGGMNGLVFLGLCFTALFGETMVRGAMLSSKKIDAMMVDKLKTQQTTLDQGLSAKKQHLEDLKAKVMSRVIEESIQNAQGASADVSKTVDEEPDFVVIDGMKLEKKKEGFLEHLHMKLRK
jgi:hypothetical protein